MGYNNKNAKRSKTKGKEKANISQTKTKKVKEEKEEKMEARSPPDFQDFSFFSKLKNFIKGCLSLSYWINGFCLTFVIWQTTKCMTKYIEKPKGTEISMKQSANVSFPVITVCGLHEDGDGMNLTYLENVCGIW